MKANIARILPVLAFLPAAAYAQVPGDLGSDQRHREDLREAYRIEERIENARKSYGGVEIESPQTPLPATDKLSDEKVMQLQQIVFSPAPQAVPEDKMREATKTYIGQKVSMRDLYRLLGEIDGVYDAAGVLGRAVLPVQDIKNGIVTVQIIEAHIGKVTSKGGHQFRDWYVHKTVPLKSGAPIVIKPMEGALIRYNAANESQLQAELVSGTNFGETDVLLSVKEPARFSATAFADNAGRVATGRFRGGVYGGVKSILGLDEALTFSADHSDGTDGFGIHYRQPISPWGTFASVGYDSSKYKIINGTVESLKVDGDDQTISLGLSQLLWARATWTLSANAGYVISKSETRFEGKKLVGEDLGIYSLGLSLSRRDTKGIWEVNQNAAQVQEHDDRTGSFRYYTGSLMRVQWLTPKWTLIGRASYQYVEQEIVSSRQFQIGGVATVRGFEEGLLFGEDGYAATLELRHPLLDRKFCKLEGLAFIDHGAVYSEDSPTQRCRKLTSAGIGTNIALGKYIGARVAYAWPIKSYSDLEKTDTPASGRFHFSVQASF